MGIVGCEEDKLQGDLKLKSPKIPDIVKLEEAFEQRTFAKKGFMGKVNVVQSLGKAKFEQSSPRKQNDDPVHRKEI